MPNNSGRGEVVVTGMGVVTPLGLDLPSTWRGMIAGVSGVRAITAFDPSGLGVRIAGGIAEDGVYASRLLGRPTQTRREHFALRALDEALASAGLDDVGLAAGNLGIFS